MVTGLPSLQSLVLSLRENLAELCGFGESLFFSCPPSIKQLKIEFKEQHLSDSDYRDFKDTHADQNRTLKDINDMDEETTLFPTQNPLSKLRSLFLCADEIRFPKDRVLSMLTHCSGLRELGLFSLEENMSETTMLEIGHLIATRCPKLEILHHSPAHLDNDGPVILGIMETLPPQSLTELHLKSSTTPSTN